jgi:peptidyl-prolyl cis-trans isomerase C
VRDHVERQRSSSRPRHLSRARGAVPLLVGLLVAGACAKKEVAPPAAAAGGAEILAKVDGVSIRVADLQDRLDRLQGAARARMSSPEGRKDLLEAAVERELLAKAALRRGYDKTPEVERVFKQALIAELFAREIDAKVSAEPITPAEIEAYYKAHAAEFQRAGAPLAIEQVSGGIRGKLLQERRAKLRQELLAGLRKELAVSVFEDKLALLRNHEAPAP